MVREQALFWSMKVFVINHLGYACNLRYMISSITCIPYMVNNKHCIWSVTSTPYMFNGKNPIDTVSNYARSKFLSHVHNV